MTGSTLFIACQLSAPFYLLLQLQKLLTHECCSNYQWFQATIALNANCACETIYIHSATRRCLLEHIARESKHHQLLHFSGEPVQGCC
jgi:hypothetical protein